MKRLRFLLVLAACAALAGCQRETRGFSFRDMLAKVRGPDERQLVTQMFESDDPDLRRSAIEALSRKKKCRREPYLKGYAVLAGDPAPTVRSAAVRALGLGRDATYIDELVAALTDPDVTVRWDAAVALDSVPGEAAIRPLAHAALNDEYADVRSAAAGALRHYPRADVAETLLRCLEDPDFCVRFKAGESLTEMTGREGGTDPARWREVLASEKDVFAAREDRSRPWWDLLRLTRRKRPAEQPTTAPAGG